MKGYFCLAAFTVVLVLAKAEESKACYDWDKEMKRFTDTCEKCKQSGDKAEVDKCMYKEWGVIDADGKVVPSKVLDSYLKGVEETKAEAVKKAITGCFDGKTEPLTERKAIEEIWKCADKAMLEACPEMKPYMEKALSDPELKICMYEK